MRAATRKRIKTSQFALPGRRYPTDTRARAANAKGRATQMYRAGKLSRSAMRRVHAQANRRLRRKR